MKPYYSVASVLFVLITWGLFEVNAQSNPEKEEENILNKETRGEQGKGNRYTPRRVNKAKTRKVKKDEYIFMIVEKRPTPKGGRIAFYRYIAKNLKYPDKARKNKIEGRVIIECVVEKDGSLSTFKVRKGIGGGCDEEAIRVLKLAPKWNPAKQRGESVRHRIFVPIVFKLG